MGRTEFMSQGEALGRAELEQQDVELLPDREEMSLVNVNGTNVHANGILNGSFHFNHTTNTIDLV
jgi:hypothetical protein